MNNFHVIAVHFPIALLTIYSLMEIFRLRRLTALPYWFYIKASFAILGAGGAAGAVVTGELIESQFSSSIALKDILEVHELAGLASAGLFGLIALLYILAWASRAGHPSVLAGRAASLAESSGMIALAAIGLGLITLTGALGGAMAFGPDVDPLARFIYDLFGF